MENMMNFFGKKKAPTASTVSATSTVQAKNPQTTIVKLRESIENQDKREEHISRKIETMVTEAKAKLAKGDKKGALFAMKRKKLYEAEVDKIQNVKMTLETQVINLESAAQNHETFQALKAGGSTLKEMRSQVDIGNVDDIMDELKEEMEIAQEINQAIAQPLDPLMTDDDELLAELNALEVSDLEAELLAPPTQSAGFSLPTVPNSKMPSLEESEAEDLRALEAELGM